MGDDDDGLVVMVGSAISPLPGHVDGERAIASPVEDIEGSAMSPLPAGGVGDMWTRSSLCCSSSIASACWARTCLPFASTTGQNQRPCAMLVSTFPQRGHTCECWSSKAASLPWAQAAPVPMYLTIRLSSGPKAFRAVPSTWWSSWGVPAVCSRLAYMDAYRARCPRWWPSCRTICQGR